MDIMQTTTSSTSSPAMASRRPQQMSGNDVESQEDFSEMISEVSTAVGKYCARRPRVVAGCVFSLGFIVGWKMRPW
jgi:hypothetical protein